MPTFTTGNDTHVVDYLGTYSLSLLAGNDTLTLASGATIVAHLDDGNDLVTIGADAGPYRVYGDNGSDTFDLFSGNGSVNGGSGNNVFNIRGGTGHDLSGGAEIDTFTFFANVEDILIRGGSGNDVLNGGNRVITGSLYGGAGSDYFLGFTTYGAVSLYGGLDNDIYRIAANHSDVRIVEYYNQGDDLIQLPGGMDYILPANVENLNVGNFAGSTGADAEISGNGLANRILGGDNAETVLGRGGDDDLRGNGGDDVLDGSAGNDSLDGGAGNDELYGGTGNDVLNGRAGYDYMAGGSGDDIYFIGSAYDQISELYDRGTDTVRVNMSGYVLPDNVENAILVPVFPFDGMIFFGNALANEITGSDHYDYIQGGGGNDTIYLGLDSDQALGGDGRDTIYGQDGNDILWGENAGDTLIGGAGTDALIGGLSPDILTGGTGSDQFVFDQYDSVPPGYDTITDGDPDGDGGRDIIDLRGIDANLNVAGDQAFTWSFSTPTAYSLWYGDNSFADGVYLLIYLADTNGDTTPDFELYVYCSEIFALNQDILL
ncbi:hypothetical protein H8M03_04155 [Sphingomonas sabuli]|uniref:Calcium-binding protein n=1 Tax=Sphingomonas sabuli TaxID=2764186 RepID=A0A7G9L4I2_9SPHN|nr:calcium-binding protein [Sphingomonas sabuli]QNM83531.1 hypothetical protein H8M03_04155 [Sphingomonas sabuli]